METIPCAYVADGNHRSAAAAQLGREHFLNVLFPTDRMGLAPYNRLVRGLEMRPEIEATASGESFLRALEQDFEVSPSEGVPDTSLHTIGLYLGGNSGGAGAEAGSGRWFRLTARPHTVGEGDAVKAIDADIVQRCVFDRVMGITDPRDERLTFVGGDRPPAYLVERVDSGEQAMAVLLESVL